MADYGLPNVCNCCAPSCPTPIAEGQSHSESASQCGYIPEVGNLWTGAYYHGYKDVIEETYGTNYYTQIVKAITPSQPNPTTWTLDSTKDFVNGICTTTDTKSANYDTWIQWIDCFNRTATSATSWTNDCSVDEPGTSNDRSRTQTRTYSQQATNAELTQIVNQRWANYTWPTEPTTIGDASYGVTYTTPNGVPSAFWSAHSLSKARYRYSIPEGTNTYMKYVVEETFTPEDYDPQNPELSPKVVTEKTITWAGPGTLGDADSWATSWQTLETSTPGTKSVALVKYQCYTGGPWIYT